MTITEWRHDGLQGNITERCAPRVAAQASTGRINRRIEGLRVCSHGHFPWSLFRRFAVISPGLPGLYRCKTAEQSRWRLRWPACVILTKCTCLAAAPVGKQWLVNYPASASTELVREANLGNTWLRDFHGLDSQ